MRDAYRTMDRVRAAAEILAERWREQGGFELEAAVGVPDAGGRRGVPAVLDAFYSIVGSLDFVEPTPDDWPALHELDPLQVFPYAYAASGESDRLFICHDPLIKAGLGGVGPLYVRRDDSSWDPVLHFEGRPGTRAGRSR